MYDIEKHIYGRSAGDRLYVRRQHSKPKVEAFRSWAEQQLGCISGKSDLALRALDEGLSGVMVALAFPNVNYVNLEEVAGRMKAVPLDCDTLQTGRDLGVCFGD